MTLKLCLAIFIFLTGFQCGRWDAKHGAEVGFKAGKWLRSILSRQGEGS